ncbi:MAG TPA: GNAT family N-acetyltransferase [Rectinemataceae bacterium]|nr:GNAT family N-acetyltransferase [Rectinemataceae bacterium]
MDGIFSLEHSSLAEVHAAFVDAFSEYEVPIDMPEGALREMLETRSYRPDFSYGYFADGKLASFILVGIRTRGGVLTAYDSGTGTIKDFQGKGIGSRLLEDTIGRLKARGVRRFLLEVLEHNEAAQSLYRRYGFAVTRKLNCYKREGGPAGVDAAAEGRPGLESLVDAAESITFAPSWQNEYASYLNAIERHDFIADAAEPRNFGIVHKRNGSILQLGLSADSIGSEKEKRLFALLERGGEGRGLKYLNVEEGAKIEEVLARNGFGIYISQYEMALDL